MKLTKKFKWEARDAIFVMVIAAMTILAFLHDSRSEYLLLTIDISIGAFAIRSWAPWRRFRKD